MKRSGVADLWLHPGRAPEWLLRRMMRLADALFVVMVEEHGTEECLRKLGDPLWFQALSNVLGYDWDSSGSTTVTCGVLRSVLNPERHGLAGAGGKGARSRRTPAELMELGEKLDLGEEHTRRLVYASRMTAKVDTAALQDGYQLYHHTIFVEVERGRWAVVQQGMDPETRTARRYHWISEGLSSFVEEPHSGLISERRKEEVLDLTARESRGCRDTCAAIAREEPPERLRRQLASLPSPSASYYDTTLTRWFDSPPSSPPIPHHRIFSHRMNWRTVRRIYDVQPRNFEELLAVRGVGPSTVRALALLSDLVYGEPPCWRDPVRMTFAFGGKDGVPFPVNRQSYDEAIAFLEDAIDRSRLGRRDKLQAFRRLRRCLPH